MDAAEVPNLEALEPHDSRLAHQPIEELQRTTRFVVDCRRRGELSGDDRQRLGRVLHQVVDVADFDSQAASVENKRPGAPGVGGVASQLPRQMVDRLLFGYRYGHVQPQAQDGGREVFAGQPSQRFQAAHGLVAPRPSSDRDGVTIGRAPDALTA